MLVNGVNNKFWKFKSQYLIAYKRSDSKFSNEELKVVMSDSILLIHKVFIEQLKQTIKKCMKWNGESPKSLNTKEIIGSTYSIYWGMWLLLIYIKMSSYSVSHVWTKADYQQHLFCTRMGIWDSADMNICKFSSYKKEEPYMVMHEVHISHQ